MAILSGPRIVEEVKAGCILVEPFDPELVNPASVDLRLGSKVALYTDAVHDVKRESSFIVGDIPQDQGAGDGLELEPGRLYLMHTFERVYTKHFVPVLDGKSSIGRLGIQVHMTAGYGDPGFDGQYTLEVTSVYRVRVYAGMRFCQMRFHELAEAHNGWRQLYDGNYSGGYSRGPVPSRVHRQFEKDSFASAPPVRLHNDIRASGFPKR